MCGVIGGWLVFVVVDEVGGSVADTSLALDSCGILLFTYVYG